MAIEAAPAYSLPVSDSDPLPVSDSDSLPVSDSDSLPSLPTPARTESRFQFIFTKRFWLVLLLGLDHPFRHMNTELKLI